MSRIAPLICALVAVFTLQTSDAVNARWRPPLLAGRSQLRKPRSAQQRQFFLWLTGRPRGWPGHVVDHKIALKRGGVDAWWNMQWQTISEAKAKDRWE